MTVGSKDMKMEKGKASLDILGVIDRLEVGPVELERRRFKAPYRVVRKGKTHKIELIYRFEEEVFDPRDPDSVNLASMIAVHVALNYGLFCDEMIFHGPFDRDDRRLIREMADNTAREIFVKKFLEPNPFLSGPVTELPTVKRKSYLRSRITFPQETDRGGRKGRAGKAEASLWPTDPSKYAVLSSGGKDSLLSFGLLRETGNEVHPVFINESGRHWYTALNAYRYFAESIPHTTRVWTNADRVFTWMLRHLPFVRADFARLRSDDYPIRLWTVAVFLFGALPILRKRGIGRLVIGDEFDTTQGASHRGIPHYNGLYDQSIHFDRALSDYFLRKGWGVSQFSILRPLSELLIEKILAARYPELLRHQLSCHAAHKEGERMHPCGRCEKCRRIVGMLSALDADPGRCGYTRKQIEDCLAALEKEALHQESEGAEHLAFLLREKGLIRQESIGPDAARRNPEVMKLRFDREMSPMESIPVDLRMPLYRILLEYADGAARRVRDRWRGFDPLVSSSLKTPFYNDATGPGTPTERNQRREESVESKSSYVLGTLTWPEARDRFKEVDVVLLPVGSIEQHGPHLPLDTDAFDAEYLARQVAASCRDPRPIVLPLIPYGVSYQHDDFRGTVSISPDTLSQLVYEIGMNVASQGIKKLVIVNGHGGNSPALHFASQMINRDAHIFTCVDTGETSDPDVEALADTPNDVHAGEIETSTSLAVRPDLVRMEAARKFVPRFSSRYLNFSTKRSVGWYAHVAKLSPKGVLGDPTKASREKGERMWEVMIRNLVEFVEDLKSLSLEEIYQRRY